MDTKHYRCGQIAVLVLAADIAATAFQGVIAFKFKIGNQLYVIVVAADVSLAAYRLYRQCFGFRIIDRNLPGRGAACQHTATKQGNIDDNKTAYRH